MKLLKLFILISSMGVLQWYSAKFWIGMTDSDIGILLSLMIEAISLLLWFERRYLSASIASLVVLTAVMSHLASDSISKIETAKKSNVLNNSLVAVTDALKKADGKNWAYTMQKSIDTINTLATVTTKDKVLDVKSESVAFTWVKIAIQIVGLTIIQLGQIIIVLSLGLKEIKSSDDEDDEQKEHKEHNQEQPKEQQENILEPTLISSYACRVKKELLTYMEEHSITVPSQLMHQMDLGRAIYTKLNNTCNQKEKDATKTK